MSGDTDRGCGSADGERDRSRDTLPDDSGERLRGEWLVWCECTSGCTSGCISVYVWINE